MPPVITMRPFWRPGGVGNGRIWLAGTVDPTSPDITSIQWRINSSEWVDGYDAVAAGEEFGFFVTGDAPSEWGTATFTGAWAQPTGTYYTMALDTEPKFIRMDGARVGRVDDVGDLVDNELHWLWDDGTLYLRTIGDVTPGIAQALTDPIFARGTIYHVEVQATDVVAGTATLVDETFIWQYETDNNIDRMMKLILPGTLTDSAFGRALYKAYAREMADLVIFYEDLSAQFNPATATWALGMWEDMMGIATRPNLSFDDRRGFINSRRSLDPTKTGFYQAVTAVAGSIEITDRYSEYRIDLRLTTADDDQLRSAVERLIDEKKPVGILVNVNYSAFRAGISKAGDSL
jgi:uncharacterized protein DUF2313